MAEQLSSGNIGVWTGNQWIPLQHPLQHVPHRGSDVEAWIKEARDAHVGVPGFEERVATLDNMLDAYRLHADTGTLLGADSEGRDEEIIIPTAMQGSLKYTFFGAELPQLPGGYSWRILTQDDGAVGTAQIINGDTDQKVYEISSKTLLRMVRRGVKADEWLARAAYRVTGHV